MIDAYICVHHHHHNHQNKNHHNILQHHHTPSFLQCLRRRVNRQQKRPKQDHKRKLPVTLFFGNSFFKTVYNSLLLILFVKQKIVKQVCISPGFDKYLIFQSFWTVVSSHNRHVSIKNDKKIFSNSQRTSSPSSGAVSVQGSGASSPTEWQVANVFSHFLSFVAILMIQVANFFLIFFSCHHYDIICFFCNQHVIIIVTFFFCKQQQKQVKTEIIQESTLVFCNHWIIAFATNNPHRWWRRLRINQRATRSQCLFLKWPKNLELLSPKR